LRSNKNIIIIAIINKAIIIKIFFIFYI
jgi:hypothetical protein